MPDDPKCTACGHNRSEHGEEPPYECFAEADYEGDWMCACGGFELGGKVE